MIIVLFHVLYLFGKYVYDNLNGRKEKTEETVAPNQILNVSEADYRDFIQPDYDSKSVKIKFFPPVYVQRYNTVQNVLASGEYHGKIRKVFLFLLYFIYYRAKMFHVIGEVPTFLTPHMLGVFTNIKFTKKLYKISKILSSYLTKVCIASIIN